MALIELADVYDAKLKALITDFGQTREILIQELIDAELARRTSVMASGETSPRSAQADVSIRLNPNTQTLLTHTKIVSARIDGREVLNPKWGGIREQLHLRALGKFGNLDAVRATSGANLKPGKYEKDGYKYLPTGRFSIQGVSANESWEHSLKLAKALGISVHLDIAWRDKPDAAHPGKCGLLEWSPGATASM